MSSEAVILNPVTKTHGSSNSGDIARGQIRGSSLFLIGNVISLAITFFPHLVLVRFLSTEAYGHWAYALSLIAIGKTYALSFNEAMSRFVPIYYAKQELSKVIGTVVVVFAVTLLISGMLLGAFALAPNLILALLTKGKESPGLLFVLMFLIPLETTDLLIMNLFACFARAQEIFWGRYIIPPALRALAIATIVAKHLDLRVLAYGYLAVELITILLFGTLIFCHLRRSKLLQRVTSIHLPIREIFSFNVPLMASGVIGMIGGSIPVLLLGYFHPITTVAYYRVVLPAAVLSSMIPANFMPLYVPTASCLFAKGDTSAINDLFWETSLWMTVLAFPVFLATACFAQPITIFLYGARYVPSAPILAILSCGYFVNVVFAFNGVTLKVLGKVRLMVILNIVTPMIIVLFNLLLIPRFGALGAAVATAAGIIVQSLLRQLGLWRWGGGISFFEKRHTSFYLVLSLSALGLYLIQVFVADSIYIALTLAIAVALVTVFLVKTHLKIADTFPEVAHIPLLGKFLA